MYFSDVSQSNSSDFSKRPITHTNLLRDVRLSSRLQDAKTFQKTKCQLLFYSTPDILTLVEVRTLKYKNLTSKAYPHVFLFH